MLTKSKITFVMPEALHKEFREQIIKDGYDMRGKSRWIQESILFLLELRNFPELVNLSYEMKDYEKVEYLVIPKAFKKNLDQAGIAVRQSYPTIEGVQSGIVRTAILQRLLRS